MSYSTPDLTGINPNYAVPSDLYVIFTNSQRIDFDVPIYLNSLVIKVGGVPLVQGTDWSVAVQDYTAMSRMMLLDTTFNQVLVRSIQLTATGQTLPYQIACSYQQLYGKPSSVAAVTQTAPKLLPLDPNKTLPGNVVTESYAVNTFANQNLIIPACGAFFADSITLTLQTNPVIPLTAGTDYSVVGLDKVKTKTTTNTSGVYNAILLTRPLAGNVTVTYHAYGGAATLGDLTALYQAISNVTTYLAANSFLTPDTLGTNVVIAGIISRLVALEASAMGTALSPSASAEIFESALTNWFSGKSTTTPSASGEWYDDGGIPAMSQ
jgi:hypothetical protein